MEKFDEFSCTCIVDLNVVSVPGELRLRISSELAFKTDTLAVSFWTDYWFLNEIGCCAVLQALLGSFGSKVKRNSGRYFAQSILGNYFV